MQRLEFLVTQLETNLRLDEFLARRVSQLSRIKLKNLIAVGAATINSEPGRAGLKVKTNDVIVLDLTSVDVSLSSMTPEDIPLEIMYEDADFCLVNKPAGMLMHPTRGVKTGTLVNALVFHFNRDLLISHINDELKFPAQANSQTNEFQFPFPAPVTRPGLIHRLDRATSGLVVVAKNQRALGILAKHFHERKVGKKYLALLRGIVREDELEINAPIGRCEDELPQWNVRADGKEASSRLRVSKRFANNTFVELAPVTGRTNQLRIHCAHIGHPIVGDAWYGGLTNEAKEDCESSRLCLHAAELTFNHPSSGKQMNFVSPFPPELLSDHAETGTK